VERQKTIETYGQDDGRGSRKSTIINSRDNVNVKLNLDITRQEGKSLRHIDDGLPAATETEQQLDIVNNEATLMPATVKLSLSSPDQAAKLVLNNDDKS
jgi:hypothetical protein